MEISWKRPSVLLPVIIFVMGIAFAEPTFAITGLEIMERVNA